MDRRGCRLLVGGIQPQDGNLSFFIVKKSMVHILYERCYKLLLFLFYFFIIYLLPLEICWFNSHEVFPLSHYNLNLRGNPSQKFPFGNVELWTCKYRVYLFIYLLSKKDPRTSTGNVLSVRNPFENSHASFFWSQVKTSIPRNKLKSVSLHQRIGKHQTGSFYHQ